MNFQPLPNPFDTIRLIVDQIIEIVEDFSDVPNLSDDACRHYLDVCRSIPEQIQSGTLKIAVVGVIKSGKSTLVNSLIGKDIVQRGAGVVTSITTRIRKGKKNCANITFKSWDQVNSQLESAVRLFPEDESAEALASPFDLRRHKDRSRLKEIYQKMLTRFPLKDGQVLPEAQLIRHALDGYEKIQALVQADESRIRLRGKEFDRHKEFTADANSAFFIRDVCLELYGKTIESGIEIADCQGADSTDPAGLEQVLEYIEQANLIIYCISSRNGLRQSDIAFLNRIKAMGLLEQVVVINNCDLTEHDGLDDLKKIESRIIDEIQVFNIRPKLFSFSCLYELYRVIFASLSKKDKVLQKMWADEKQMVAYCDEQKLRFSAYFQKILETFRGKLLIESHLNRLKTILADLDRQIRQFSRALCADQDQKEQIKEKYARLYEDTLRLESIVNNSMGAAVKGLEKDIQNNLTEALLKDKAELIFETKRFIDNLVFDVEPFRRLAADKGFNQVIYMVFHDFRRQLDLFVIEQIKPQVKRIVMEQEALISSHFASLLKSYRIDFISVLLQDSGDNGFNKDQPISSDLPAGHLFDFARTKELLGISLPNKIFYAEYSTGIKTNIFFEFGWITLQRIVMSLLDKKNRFSFTPSFKKADERIRQYTAKQLRNQIDQYQSLLMHDYMGPLIAAATREFRLAIEQRFADYKSYKDRTDKLLELREEEKKAQLSLVSDLKKRIHKVFESLAVLQEKLSDLPDAVTPDDF